MADSIAAFNDLTIQGVRGAHETVLAALPPSLGCEERLASGRNGSRAGLFGDLDLPRVVKRDRHGDGCPRTAVGINRKAATCYRRLPWSDEPELVGPVRRQLLQSGNGEMPVMSVDGHQEPPARSRRSRPRQDN